MGDAANRMVHAEDGTGLIQADYGYDPFGRRLWKNVDNITTYFLYTDEGLLAECSSDGTARTYGYLPGTSTPLFLKQNGEYYWYRTDRLGIPHTLVESNGHVVWSGIYDAFGNCEIGVETVESNLRLPGQYYDEETSLYYNLNRYYDPKIGRYLQPDPAGAGLNPYIYVGGNPVNAIDPLGLCALRIVGGGADIWAGIGLIGGALSGPPGWLAVGAGIVGGLTVLNGADNLIAGGRTAISGEYTRSFGEAAIHRYVQNDLAADLLYTGSQLLLGYAGIRADRAMRATSIRAAMINANRSRTAMLREKFGTISPQQLHQRINLRGAVTNFRNTLRTTPYLTRMAHGPVLSGIMDTVSGGIFYGLNTERILTLHPALSRRISSLEGLHSEVIALNKALWARGASSSADLSEFLLFNVRFSRNLGTNIPRCGVCQGITNGVISLSDTF